MQLEDITRELGRAALEILKSESEPVRDAGIELQARVRTLLEDQALIAARAMAGQAVRTDQAALDARLKALTAAGLSIGQREIQAAVHGAITAALRLAFGLLT